MVASIDYIERLVSSHLITSSIILFASTAFDLFHAYRPQSRRPIGARYRTFIQDGSFPVRSNCEGVDKEVCTLAHPFVHLLIRLNQVRYVARLQPSTYELYFMAV